MCFSVADWLSRAPWTIKKQEQDLRGQPGTLRIVRAIMESFVSRIRSIGNVCLDHWEGLAKTLAMFRRIIGKD